MSSVDQCRVVLFRVWSERQRAKIGNLLKVIINQLFYFVESWLEDVPVIFVANQSVVMPKGEFL